jgi:Spy/CpxP family protein refolding chaperone
MKQLLMTIVAAVMFSSAAMAQDQEKGKKKEEMAKHRTEKMVKDYDLNESQAAKLLELNTKYADKMRPHHGPRGPHGPHGMKGQRPEPPKGDMKGERPEPPTKEMKAEMEKKRAEMEKEQKAYDAELQKILTPDQYKLYQHDMQKHRKGGPRPGPKPEQ